MGFATVAGKNRMLDALVGTASGSPITHVGLLTKGPNITGVTSTGSPDTFTKTSHGLSNGDLIVPSAQSSATSITAITSTGSPDTFTKTAHGLVNGDRIVFTAATGGAGLVLGQAYFIVGSAANTFQIALTAGGAAIDLTSDITAATAFKLSTSVGGLIDGFPYFVVSTAANTFQLALTSGGSAIDLSADLTSATVNKLTEISGGSPAYARVAQAYAAAAAGLVDDSTNGAVLNVPAGGVVDYHGFWTASTAGTLMKLDDVTQETFAAQGTYTVVDTKTDMRETGGLG